MTAGFIVTRNTGGHRPPLQSYHFHWCRRRLQPARTPKAQKERCDGYNRCRDWTPETANPLLLLGISSACFAAGPDTSAGGPPPAPVRLCYRCIGLSEAITS